MLERKYTYQRINAYGSKRCSAYGDKQDRNGQRICKSCHATYMRANRPKYAQLSESAKKKANCRSYSKVLQRRGELAKGPCRVPGCHNPAENHHPDYRNPLEIFRYCREHHLKQHWVR
jgi:hypothetical protein